MEEREEDCAVYNDDFVVNLVLYYTVAFPIQVNSLSSSSPLPLLPL